MRFQMQSEKERHVILFTHMAFDMADPLTVLRPMSVVGKTLALAWMRIVGRALPRRRENRVPHRYSGGRRRWPLLEWRLSPIL
jgi:hypothetical protein